MDGFALMLAGRKPGDLKSDKPKQGLFELLMGRICNLDQSDYWATAKMSDGVQDEPIKKATVPTFTAEEEEYLDKVEVEKHDDEGRLNEEISLKSSDYELIPTQKIPKFD
jgi:hypothetical protein